MKRIESLLKFYMKFEFKNLEIGFHKRQVSFLVVKTIKCKRGIIFERLEGSNRWQLDSKTEKVPSLSPG